MRRKHLRFLAIALGVACLLALLKPGYVHETPAAGEKRTRVTLGLPSSPWLQFNRIHIDRRVESPAGVSHMYSDRTEWGVELVTWSGLLAVAGVGFLFLARMLKRSPLAAGFRP
jgi:hypothetical protein